MHPEPHLPTDSQNSVFMKIYMEAFLIHKTVTHFLTQFMSHKTVAIFSPKYLAKCNA